MLRRPHRSESKQYATMHRDGGNIVDDDDDDDDLDQTNTTPLLSTQQPSSLFPPPYHKELRARFHKPPSRLWLLFKSCTRCLVDVVHFLFSTFTRYKTQSISLLQSQRLDTLRHRIHVPFDATNQEHIDKLKKLWNLSFPRQPFPPGIKSPLWKEMGWQGLSPETDFRAGGILALDMLLYMAEEEPDTYSMLLEKKRGIRSNYEYPFAVAGVHVTLLVIETCFNSTKHGGTSVITRASVSAIQRQAAASRNHGSLHGDETIGNRGFIRLLGQSEEAFERIFVECFKTLDEVWLTKRATYMEFAQVSREVKRRLERVLSKSEWVTLEDLDTGMRREYV